MMESYIQYNVLMKAPEDIRSARPVVELGIISRVARVEIKAGRRVHFDAVETQSRNSVRWVDVHLQAIPD